MKKILIALITGSLFIPIAAYAVGIEDGVGTIGGLVNLITSKILNALITLFATGALAAFFFGMVQFILASRDGDTKKIGDGKQFMLWSVIALFVMFSIWGIVNYAQTIFGFRDNTITIPQIVPAGSSGATTGGGGLPSGGGVVGADCTVNAECGASLVCTNFKCAQPASSSGNLNADCTNNSECTGGLTCRSFTCQP